MPEYTFAASGVLAVAAIFAALRGVLRRRAVWIGLAIFALLTVTVDVLLTRVGVYGHGSAVNAGILIDRMPIEDLMYGIALYLVAVVAWSWNRSREVPARVRAKPSWQGIRLVSELMRASRPFSWINTVLPFVAVALSLQHRFTPALVLGALYFLAPYNLLLYGVNDLFDFESDRHNPRKGGFIEGGLIPPRDARALWSAIALLTLPLLLLIAWLTPAAALAIALSGAVALAYSLPPLRLKEVPGLDALTASLAFVLPAVTGAILAGASPGHLPWLYLFAFLIWGVASQALGAIQDVPYDRTAHIQSIAAWLGEGRTALLATGAYLMTAVMVASTGGPSLIAAAALLPYALLSASCLLGNPSRWARRAWKGFLGLNLLSGFVITMVLLQTGAVAILSETP
jgi:lycopene elongase/hydratase (flavuxanthin-forming)